jgi:hypothetical protein
LRGIRRELKHQGIVDRRQHRGRRLFEVGVFLRVSTSPCSRRNQACARCWLSAVADCSCMNCERGKNKAAVCSRTQPMRGLLRGQRVGWFAGHCEAAVFPLRGCCRAGSKFDVKPRVCQIPDATGRISWESAERCKGMLGSFELVARSSLRKSHGRFFGRCTDCCATCQPSAARLLRDSDRGLHRQLPGRFLVVAPAAARTIPRVA